MKLLHVLILIMMHCQILHAAVSHRATDESAQRARFLHEFSDREMQTIFPNASPQAREGIRRASEIQLSFFKGNVKRIDYNAHKKPQQGCEIHGGSNFSTLSNMHTRVLKESVGKDVLEIGPGYGLFSMYLCFNAASIHLLEVSTDCTDYLEHQLRTNARPWTQSNVTVENADVTSAECTISTAKYDAIPIFNVLHYMTPTNAKITLEKAKEGLKDQNARIFVIMDVVTTFGLSKVIEHYLEAESDGLHFPGFLRYYFIGDYEPSNSNKTERLFAWTNEARDSEIDPMTVLKKIDSSGKTDQSIITYFGGDINSMRRLFCDAGLSIVGIYYQAQITGEIFYELTSDILHQHNDIKICAELKLPDPS